MPEFVLEVVRPAGCGRKAFTVLGPFSDAMMWARWLSKEHRARVSVGIRRPTGEEQR